MLKPFPGRFPSAREDAESAKTSVFSSQTQSETYILAYADQQFIMRDELRAVRLQLELMKPEIILHEHGVEATVVMFGGTRIPEHATARVNLEKADQEASLDPADLQAGARARVCRRIFEKSHYYEEARRLAFIITKEAQYNSRCSYMVATGGGPGIMEAANRGAAEAGGKSIGLNIVLPHEQTPNRYITPDLCFQFHYFAIRKMHFLIRAKALVVFPGGYGTMDELFEILTLIQTKKIKPLPVLLFGKEFWEQAVDFTFLMEEGLIAPEDLAIFQFVESAEEVWRAICDFYDRDHGEK